jgi:mRNA-degrading endonuclease HigB of HigAB toxin-antitoxin module
VEVASRLVNKYNSDISFMLATLYPDVEWMPWKFHISRNYWKQPENVKKFLDWAGKNFNVKKIEDWYKVSSSVIQILT